MYTALWQGGGWDEVYDPNRVLGSVSRPPWPDLTEHRHDNGVRPDPPRRPTTHHYFATKQQARMMGS